MWARIMTERFGAEDDRSKVLRFHTQTGGSTLTAQQPENNIVRVTTQALAAVLGGTQSLHTNGFDEALGLPTTNAAKIALRTQQIVANESGVADTVDPLAGSWFVESLTDQVESAAWDYLKQIDAMGGAVAAIENGFMQGEIEQAAYAFAKAVDDQEKIVVGVNKYVDPESQPAEVFPLDPDLARAQKERTKRVRAERDQGGVDSALSDLSGGGSREPEPSRPDARGPRTAGDPGRGFRCSERRVRRISAGSLKGQKSEPQERATIAGHKSGPQERATRAGLQERYTPSVSFRACRSL